MLYTGHGDAGYTHVIGGPALPKCDARLEALGALDEAQAHLGLARALIGTPWTTAIQRVQTDLRALMGAIATMPADNYSPAFSGDHQCALEADLSCWDRRTGGFSGFVTPGDSVFCAHLHLARTVIRRAERTIVGLSRQDHQIDPRILSYLNRLSSWVYALTLVIDLPADLPASM